MFEESSLSSSEPFSNPAETTQKASLRASSEVVAASSEVRSKSARELAEQYGVSDRTVQSWFKAVCAAYFWIDPETLKTGRSAKTRYSPLCQQFIAQYRASANNLSEEDWIASIHAVNPDKLAASPPQPHAASTNATVESIPVLPTQKLNKLEELAEKASEMSPYRRSDVVLNGAQDDAIDAIALIAERVEQMQQRNEAKRQALETRRRNLQQMEGVMTTLISVGRAAEQEAFDLNDESKDLKRDEADLKKKLSEALQNLS